LVVLSGVDIVSTETETTAPVELIFEFSGDCWMNLTDATGEDIAYGVKVKGRVMPVTGIPPFVVTLGAPEVVKIRYAGERIDMSFLPFGRIAKFDLPLSE
jgi:cytoskeleton protein RodZ